LAAYQNCFTGAFVFDDLDSITGNPKIRHLWPLWEPLSLLRGPGATVEGRPVVNFTFAINYALGGLTPWGYHALNLAIHILAGLTLYGITRRTLLRPLLRDRFGASATRLAVATAVIWTVHPLQTEAVTYVVQRAESLMGLFYLLSMYCFIRGVESGKPGRWYALSVTSCLLGMGSKEVMVSAPMLVLLYDRMFVAGSFREAWKRRGRLYAGLASTWVILGYLVANAGSRGGSVGFETEVAWWTYLLTQCRAIVLYLKLSVWPHPLVFDYGTATVEHMGRALLYALVLVALATGTVVALWRRQAIGFLGVWFFGILAPSSSVVPIATQTMAEHRMYLPLAALVMLGVVAIDAAMVQRRSATVFLALALGLGFLTARRNEDYRAALSIWQDTVTKCPDNARAHSSLGRALLDAGRFPEAVAECQEAVRITPDSHEAHFNLAFTLESVGRVPDAIEQYQEALRSFPGDVEAHVDLGNAFLRTGRIQEATSEYAQALRVDPDCAEAHSNIGAIDQRQGNLTEAVSQYGLALRINPDYVEAHFNLGLALEKLGRTPEAMDHYRQALKLRPDFVPARNALARLQVGQ
jgi:Flp pilus assembly protein TadD